MKEVAQLDGFRKALASNLSPSQVHDRELDYMAKHGIRQIGPPRIRIFADRQRPEPVHNEINAWQHLLNLMYRLALERGKIDDFITILSSPVGQTSDIVKLSPVSHSIVSHPDGVGERVSKIEAGCKQLDSLQKCNQKAAEENNNNSIFRNVGCGPAFIARLVREHYNDQPKRNNNLFC